MFAVQEVFDKVILHGFYNPCTTSGKRMGMCAALSHAHWEGESISAAELADAIGEIKKYLQLLRSITGRQYVYLDQYLKYLNIPSDSNNLLAIYRDWNNRPMRRLATADDVIPLQTILYTPNQ